MNCLPVTIIRKPFFVKGNKSRMSYYRVQRPVKRKYAQIQPEDLQQQPQLALHSSWHNSSCIVKCVICWYNVVSELHRPFQIIRVRYPFSLKLLLKHDSWISVLAFSNSKSVSRVNFILLTAGTDDGCWCTAKLLGEMWEVHVYCRCCPRPGYNSQCVGSGVHSGINSCRVLAEREVTL